MNLPAYQLLDVWQSEIFVQRDEVGLGSAGAHQMNPGQQHSVYIEERFDPWWVLFLEQAPLCCGEPKVMMAVMASHAAFSNLFQFFVCRAALNDQRGVELFQHIPVTLKQH